MNELLPVTAGLVVGVVLGGVTAGRRPWVWLAASVVLGVAATVLTGEWKVSWAYLLVDIPLVALSAAAHMSPLLAAVLMPLSSVVSILLVATGKGKGTRGVELNRSLVYGRPDSRKEDPSGPRLRSRPSHESTSEPGDQAIRSHLA